MPKQLFLIVFLILFSCSDNSVDTPEILPNVPVNVTVYLNNPENIDLQVPGGWVYHKGGISGLIIRRNSTDTYVAWERAAPHLKPQACSKMVVKNSMIMFCECDNSQFSILNGAPITEGIKYAARQYRVINNGNTLIITNY